MRVAAIRSSVGLALGLVMPCTPAISATYDIVLNGGRVIDPASGFDARRNIGIKGDKIAIVSESEIVGTVAVDVSGRVVAPGFIDLHQHGFKPSDLELKVQDGVTTALELESGVYPVADWYAQMGGKSPVNFGATVSHSRTRYAAFHPNEPLSPSTVLTAKIAVLPRAGEEQIERMEKLVQAGIAAGALGAGFGINYTPTADRAEIERLFRVAAKSKVPVFVHTRAFRIAPIREAIETAQAAGVALHIVHIGSSSLGDINRALALIDRKRRAGMDISTEVYPYAAASTRIESAMFAPGWQKNLQIDYGDIAWSLTGERLTKESFERYRAQTGWVIMYMMKEQNIAKAIAHPGVMIASDAVPFVNGTGHPRGAGTFARVLGHYSRDMKRLSLMDALAKMTILPAKRLAHVPAMKGKGHLANGADADITIFDPATIIDRATFAKPATPSAGIMHVLVNGVFVLRDGKLVAGAMPGRPIRAPQTTR